MAKGEGGGAPKGNNNAAKGRQWAQAIQVALNRREKDGRAGLIELADTLIDAALAGDMTAMKEIGDRLDGKAKQQTEVTGEGGGPVGIKVMFVAAK